MLSNKLTSPHQQSSVINVEHVVYLNQKGSSNILKTKKRNKVRLKFSSNPDGATQVSCIICKLSSVEFHTPVFEIELLLSVVSKPQKPQTTTETSNILSFVFFLLFIFGFKSVIKQRNRKIRSSTWSQKKYKTRCDKKNQMCALCRAENWHCWVLGQE